MYVPITLKRKSGKVVKSWHINGAHNIDEVLQFIWRDLFLSMLASGNQRLISKIPEMLDDIEDILGWTSLERLLYGGRKCESCVRLALSIINSPQVHMTSTIPMKIRRRRNQTLTRTKNLSRTKTVTSTPLSTSTNGCHLSQTHPHPHTRSTGRTA